MIESTQRIESSTVILINDDKIPEFEENPAKFIEHIKLSKDMTLRSQRRWHGHFGDDVKVAKAVPDPLSEFYLVEKNSLVTLNRQEIEQLIYEDKEYEAERLIKEMKQRVLNLEEDYLRILEKKDPLYGKAKRALKY